MVLYYSTKSIPLAKVIFFDKNNNQTKTAIECIPLIEKQSNKITFLHANAVETMQVNLRKIIFSFFNISLNSKNGKREKKAI